MSDQQEMFKSNLSASVNLASVVRIRTFAVSFVCQLGVDERKANSLTDGALEERIDSLHALATADGQLLVTRVQLCRKCIYITFGGVRFMFYLYTLLTYI